MMLQKRSYASAVHQEREDEEIERCAGEGTHREPVPHNLFPRKSDRGNKIRVKERDSFEDSRDTG